MLRFPIPELVIAPINFEATYSLSSSTELPPSENILIEMNVI